MNVKEVILSALCTWRGGYSYGRSNSCTFIVQKGELAKVEVKEGNFKCSIYIKKWMLSWEIEFRYVYYSENLTCKSLSELEMACIYEECVHVLKV